MQDNFYRALEDKHRGTREIIKERLKVYLPFLNIENKSLEAENKAIGLEKRLIETENKSLATNNRIVELENKALEMGINNDTTFISYAQNFEDVMLWRALKHLNKGFYIDIGAWSPDLDSVTRAFYERGWHGINIEPNPELFQELQRRRPHDINLELAIGDQEGTLSMNFLTNSGLSTLDDAIAQKHQEAGFMAEHQPVQVTTLAKIWAEHVPAGQEVHFLKVDVEGFEEKVLCGNDWEKNRPWIVVVEATKPMSQEESYASWEPMLLNAGYCYAYFDGLNRFYVAKEHSELLDALKAPPNVFDNFVLYRQQEAEARAIQAEAEAAEAKQQAAEAKQQAAEAQSVADGLNRELQSVYRSKSWRITWPLRKLMQLLRWLFRASVRLVTGLIRLPKKAARYLLTKSIVFVLRSEKLKHRAKRWLNRYPRLKAYLRAFVRARGLVDEPMPLPPHPLVTEMGKEPQALIPPIVMTLEERIAMTCSCRDADSIPKVKNAGAVELDEDGQRVQIMHNGLKVVADGYCGEWMTRIIQRLKGHHEPQEEAVFHKVVEQLGSKAVMLEVGSYWAYYSLWFLKGHAERRAYGIEPDPAHIKIGEENCRLNGLNVTFEQGYIGEVDGEKAVFDTEDSGAIELNAISVSGLVIGIMS